MEKETDIIFAFDLDGTIAPCGYPVEPRIAHHLNKLGHIHIITGGPMNSAVSATRILENKTIHALRSIPGNSSIDLSEVCSTTKKSFQKNANLQALRRRLCLELRSKIHKNIFTGGRSTIDLMPTAHKGNVIETLQAQYKRVIYFYDCPYLMNEDVNNDAPAVGVAWKSIKTDYKRLPKDLKECLKTFS